MTYNEFEARVEKWKYPWTPWFKKHSKLGKWIYEVGFFFIFSNGVTIWQLLVMLFLPAAFAFLGNTAWAWPNVPTPFLYPTDTAVLAAYGISSSLAGTPIPWVIFGDALGLGTWVAFEVAVFTAQCINFPLQRNITFKSHGNPALQALAYFIGWVLISIGVGAFWGFINCITISWSWPYWLQTLLKTFITGGISMIVFFPIFKIIFKSDEEVRLAAEKKAK
jgi:putative flippase GtrA